MVSANLEKRKSKKRKRKPQLKEMNIHAAGIDIGSEVHYVAVSPKVSNEPIRHFGCYTSDLNEMGTWLKECGIKTIAMESTGVYWIPVYQVLESHGFDVNLVDARHVSNVPGRDTDVDDCEWIRKLHSCGLLRGCFIPDSDTVTLRTYWRHRADLVAMSSREVLHMQKALEQMNIQLHKAISDITGMTGQAIIRAIIAGERNPTVLASKRQRGVKKSEEEIEKALTGNWRDEQVYLLKEAVELYDTYQQKIEECDKKVEECMLAFETKADPDDEQAKLSKSRRRSENEPHFDLKKQLYRVTGVDLTAIDGIQSHVAETIISELGCDVSAFPTEKHFSSWLGLCPHNCITGGKIRSRKTRKVQNRIADALRLAAQCLHSSKSALGAYFRRVKGRAGAPKAITATAHKLACLVYRMLRYGMEYVDQGQEAYEKQYQERVFKNLQRSARAQGYVLVKATTGEVS